MQKLWEWADKNAIPNLERIEEHGGYWVGLPRDRERLINLTCLRLNANNISELPKEIGKLTRLKELSLYKNGLERLPQEISGLGNLTRLWLGDNKLFELPEEIGSLTGLTTLNLKNNNLICLPKEIINLTKLVKIWLSGNPRLNWTPRQIEWVCDLKAAGCVLELDSYMLRMLAEVEESWGKRALMLLGGYDESRKRLEVEGEESDESLMNLWKNNPENIKAPNLTPLEDENRGYETLTKMDDGASCNISDHIAEYEDFDLAEKDDEKDNWHLRVFEWADKNSIPKDLVPRDKEALIMLKSLDLRNRGLTYLPHEIGNLINLRELSLLGNNLRELPGEIGDLTHLTWLGLANNYLTSLPSEIVNLHRLTFLRLAENHDLVLTDRQKQWLEELKDHDCRISVDEDLYERGE